MDILGRSVEAIRYGGQLLITAYIKRKQGDCQREMNHSYACLDNCEASLVVVRFLDGQPFSIKALVPQELRVDPGVPEVARLRDLIGLESLAQKKGYELQEVSPCKTLYFDRRVVATYTPCGLHNNRKLFSDLVTRSIGELVARADEITKIAEDKPLAAIVQDKVLAKYLMDPRLLEGMQTMFGAKGTELVKTLRRLKAETN